VELERLARLVAEGERDPLQLVVGVFDVFAGFARRFAVSRRTKRAQAMRRETYELRFMHSTWMGAP